MVLRRRCGALVVVVYRAAQLYIVSSVCRQAGDRVGSLVRLPVGRVVLVWHLRPGAGTGVGVGARRVQLVSVLIAHHGVGYRRCTGRRWQAAGCQCHPCQVNLARSGATRCGEVRRCGYGLRGSRLRRAHVWNARRGTRYDAQLHVVAHACPQAGDRVRRLVGL